MRTLKDLTQDEIQWLRERCGKFPRYELAGVLDINPLDIDEILEELGLGDIKYTHSCRDAYNIYDTVYKQSQIYSVEESLKFRDKIEGVKLLMKHREGKKVGPYTIVKAYPNHCLVLNSFGFRESLSYSDLARFIKLPMTKGVTV